MIHELLSQLVRMVIKYFDDYNVGVSLVLTYLKVIATYTLALDGLTSLPACNLFSCPSSPFGFFYIPLSLCRGTSMLHLFLGLVFVHACLGRLKFMYVYTRACHNMLGYSRDFKNMLVLRLVSSRARVL